MRRSPGEGSSPRRRPDGRWTASLQVAGRRYWVYGKTRQEAAQKLQALRQEAAQGGLAPPSQLTVADLLRQWLAAARLTCKPSTIHGYEVVVRCHLLPALGGVRLQRLTPQHLVQLYQAKQRQGLSPRRIGIIHAVAHRALAEAVRWRLVPRNVAAAVTPPRPVAAERPVWRLAEVRRFVATAQASSDRYAPALCLALACGLRAGELLGLRWGAVDAERGMVAIARSLTWVGGSPTWGTPKSQAGRRVLPLPALGAWALQALRRQQVQDRLRRGAAWQDAEGRIVTTRTGGVPTLNLLKRSLERLCVEAGVPRLTVHQLRHQHASLLLWAGADVKAVQRQLGHSRATTTLDVYAHLLPGQDRTLAQRLDEALGSAAALGG